MEKPEPYKFYSYNECVSFVFTKYNIQKNLEWDLWDWVLENANQEITNGRTFTLEKRGRTGEINKDIAYLLELLFEEFSNNKEEIEFFVWW